MILKTDLNNKRSSNKRDDVSECPSKGLTSETIKRTSIPAGGLHNGCRSNVTSSFSKINRRAKAAYVVFIQNTESFKIRNIYFDMVIIL
jgi:hypothetical protein